jgi:hypothetical protein
MEGRVYRSSGKPNHSVLNPFGRPWFDYGILSVRERLRFFYGTPMMFALLLLGIITMAAGALLLANHISGGFFSESMGYSVPKTIDTVTSLGVMSAGVLFGVLPVIFPSPDRVAAIRNANPRGAIDMDR